MQVTPPQGPPELLLPVLLLDDPLPPAPLLLLPLLEVPPLEAPVLELVEVTSASESHPASADIPVAPPKPRATTAKKLTRAIGDRAIIETSEISKEDAIIRRPPSAVKRPRAPSPTFNRSTPWPAILRTSPNG